MNLDKLKTHIDNMKPAVPMLEYYVHKYNDIIILGNGGSNAVASHISQDYTKKLGKRAMTFSDSSRLTCYINDYGMANAYSQFIKEFATDQTLIILISSSGNSDNIVNAAKVSKQIGCATITLSGFKKENKLNQIESEFNYWVDSEDYGEVELSHEIFLHSVC
tara:strand:- start:5320 stop:5808 length:489 start_codon:yes stop_codon:yes gene_type:complete